jgi:hypothetical protein
LRRSTLIDSGIVSTRSYPRAAATKASPTPVLPLVGSISVVLPGAILPSASAHHRETDAVLHRTERIKKFELHVNFRDAPGLFGDAIEPDQRRVTDGLGDVLE